MIAELYTTCKFCLFDGAYLFYGVFVFAVSLLAYRADASAGAVEVDRGRLPPMHGGELRLPAAEMQPKTSVVANTFAFALALANFSFFLVIARGAFRLIRALFLMTDNPTPVRSFLRYVNVYYIVILLPAAFMPPVAHAQRPPDFSSARRCRLVDLRQCSRRPHFSQDRAAHFQETLAVRAS